MVSRIVSLFQPRSASAKVYSALETHRHMSRLFSPGEGGGDRTVTHSDRGQLDRAGLGVTGMGSSQRISQMEVAAGFGGVGIGQRVDEPVRVDMGAFQNRTLCTVLTSSL